MGKTVSERQERETFCYPQREGTVWHKVLIYMFIKIVQVKREKRPGVAFCKSKFEVRPD